MIKTFLRHLSAKPQPVEFSVTLTEAFDLVCAIDRTHARMDAMKAKIKYLERMNAELERKLQRQRIRKTERMSDGYRRKVQSRHGVDRCKNTRYLREKSDGT